MTRLRVVQPGDETPEGSFADAARAALEEALQQGAVVVLIAYETPAKWDFFAVPNSSLLASGVIRTLAQWEAESAAE